MSILELIKYRLDLYMCKYNHTPKNVYLGSDEVCRLHKECTHHNTKTAQEVKIVCGLYIIPVLKQSHISFGSE